MKNTLKLVCVVVIASIGFGTTYGKEKKQDPETSNAGGSSSTAIPTITPTPAVETSAMAPALPTATIAISADSYNFASIITAMQLDENNLTAGNDTCIKHRRAFDIALQNAVNAYNRGLLTLSAFATLCESFTNISSSRYPNCRQLVADAINAQPFFSIVATLISTLNATSASSTEARDAFLAALNALNAQITLANNEVTDGGFPFYVTKGLQLLTEMITSETRALKTATDAAAATEDADTLAAWNVLSDILSNPIAPISPASAITLS